MSSQPKVLFVLTSHDQLGNTGKPTGWYLPEFAHPYYVLSPHAQITVASPSGGASPMDPSWAVMVVTMFDLASSTTSHKIINEFFSQKKIVSAVCHGPAALAYVKTPSGSYLLDGHAVTGFSTSEEDVVQMTSAMPFNLEDQLNVASGGKYEKAGSDWGEKVVVSGRIITGQNPASASGVGEAILKAIQKK